MYEVSVISRVLCYLPPPCFQLRISSEGLVKETSPFIIHLNER